MLETTLPAVVTLLPFFVLATIYLLVLHTPQGNNSSPLNPHFKVGDRVNTTAGIIGCVVKIKQKTFILESYDGALFEMTTASVTKIIT